MMKNSTVINTRIIGSCQLNVLVSPLVTAALLLSTQNKAIIDYKGLKSTAQWGCV